MKSVTEIIGAVTEWIWGLPMILLLLCGGLFLTFRLGFFQIRYLPHILRQTFGKMFKKSDEPGSVTPFQAATSALASTVGAANIVGVPVAIILGGPGAVFWMWIVSFIGMATKYSEVVLGVKYRQKNAEGDWVGGPMYYIEKGLRWRFVAWLFAFGLMLEIAASTMVQTNSISTLVKNSFDVPLWATGIGVMAVVTLATYGGIRRIGQVTEKLVPLMVSIYLIGALLVLIYNAKHIPEAFALIFTHAFIPISAVGGFAGAGIAAAIRWGLARGIYSNEAGMGTAPIAHASAKTDHPAKQGMWGIFEVIVDTMIICTMTALIVLTSGTWKTLKAEQASSMVAEAFGQIFGPSLANMLLSIVLFLFVISTVIVIVYYGEKQAEYLFGTAFSKIMRLVYIGAIMVGAVGGLQFIWQFLDLLLALIVVPNLIAVLFLSGEVRAITRDYFTKLNRPRNKKAEEERQMIKEAQ
ncbi:alanine/glycine:cation symporter family protein [Aneurinibacillus thermoaerophilus]|uniref:Sodium:alanine symporter family protein n=1 Tax=Aneurinibacillus thermoaerophilus TaxID=143495 RepID=A0ABX8YAP5_ANETH|nr:sodium:alanine symporter family protein [Aneurinibacillus thermoaerophilus]QYY42743.1 sodium:alanine symporter family protein [Aneurinibacillus thermoaerophilus]